MFTLLVATKRCMSLLPRHVGKVTLRINPQIEKKIRLSSIGDRGICVLRNSRCFRWEGVSFRMHATAADGSVEGLVKAIGDKGNEIKTIKALKAPTMKEDIAPLVQELLTLKASYKELTGEDFGAPPKESSKKDKDKDKSKQNQPKISTPKQPEVVTVYEKNRNYYEIDDRDDSLDFGDYSTMQSNSETDREFASVKDLGLSTGKNDGDKVWIRGRVASVRAKGNSCFIVIRSDSYYSVQVCHFKDKENPDPSKALIKFAEGLTLESIVDIYGTVASAQVKSCSQGNVEIQMKKLYVVSRAPVALPFLLEDANRSDDVIEASQDTDRPFARVGQDLRLNNRWLDLRVPANNAIMRIKSGVTFLYREALMNQDFVEIITPKLIPGESEGGAGVFKTDYFGRTACLAQSPQLYKQMAIASDLERVFEVGPVFRAENSNTRRHLCEFTGLDMEMSIKEHYNEALDVIHNTFRHIFNGLEEKYAKELEVIREQYPSEPVIFTEKPLIIHWHDGIQLLREAGIEHGEFEDLNTATELALGAEVKRKYGADFYILDQYPAEIRPFYTMPMPSNPKFSNSYDIFIRGQEICSGAQRCHEAEQLVEAVKAKGMELDSLAYYIESFRHGVKPHAGAGIGLERVVFLYLGLDNVRKSSMFPRDPNRVEP